MQYVIEDRIQEFNVSSATVELVSQALKCEPCRIAKTRSFLVDGSPIRIVIASDIKIGNPKFKAQFGTKAKMLKPDEVTQLVAHFIGGVCSFTVNDGVKVYLDESLMRFETVYPACNSSNSAIELTIPELEIYSAYVLWIDICKSSLS